MLLVIEPLIGPMVGPKSSNWERQSVTTLFSKHSHNHYINKYGECESKLGKWNENEYKKSVNARVRLVGFSVLKKWKEEIEKLGKTKCNDPIF